MTTDKLTTLIGVAAAVSQAAHQFNVAPEYTGLANVFAIAALGYYTNKR